MLEFSSRWPHKVDSGICSKEIENACHMEQICGHGQGYFYINRSPHTRRDSNLQYWRKRRKNKGRIRRKYRGGRINKNIRQRKKNRGKRGRRDKGRRNKDERRRGGEQRMSLEETYPHQGVEDTEGEVATTLATLDTPMKPKSKKSRPSQMYFRTRKSTRIR